MPLTFTGRGILLDVEGTTSSVSFVYDILFPYAQTRVKEFLENNWHADEVVAARELIARDAGAESFAAWTNSADVESSRPESLKKLLQEIYRLMDGDIKATGLKTLQGLIWRQGYRDGHLTSHVYDDVAVCLKNWCDAGLDVRIFSSGSVEAQKVFFAYSKDGDLLRYLKGNYDTTTGAKKEASSYRKIAGQMNLPTEEILFLSDVVQELDGAREAGMATGLVVRPGNANVSDSNGHTVIISFAEIALGAPAAS